MDSGLCFKKKTSKLETPNSKTVGTCLGSKTLGIQIAPSRCYRSYSLKLLKGDYLGDYIGDYYRGY